MKIRNGFVSNSSSSSFILANKSGNTKTTIEIDLNGLIDSTITNLDELNQHFLEKHNWDDRLTIEEILEDEWAKDEYLKAKKKLDEGYILFAGRVSNEDDDPLGYYFYSNGFEGTIKSSDFEILEEGN